MVAGVDLDLYRPLCFLQTPALILLLKISATGHKTKNYD